MSLPDERYSETQIDDILNKHTDENIPFDVGEKLTEDTTIAEKLGHGEEADGFRAITIVADRGDAQSEIEKALQYTRKKHKIGILDRAYQFSLGDKNVNATKQKLLEKARDDLKQYALEMQPYHTDRDFERDNINSVLRNDVIKWIDSNSASNPELMDKLLRDAGFISKVKGHKCVVQHYATIPKHKKGAGYLVEYVYGRLIGKIMMDEEIKRMSGVPHKDIVDAYAYFVYDALDHCHSNNVVHQDFNKNNCMESLQEGRHKGLPKIFDFGLAAHFKEGEENTVPYFMGTEVYTHPFKLNQQEQYRKENQEYHKGRDELSDKLKNLNAKERNKKLREYDAKWEGKKKPEGYIVHPALDVYSAALTVLELAMGGIYPIIGDENVADDFIKPKFRKVSTFTDQYSTGLFGKGGEIGVLYYPFQKDMEKDITKTPTAQTMRNMHQENLRKRGYKNEHEYQQILAAFVNPICEKIAGDYAKARMTKKSRMAI